MLENKATYNNSESYGDTSERYKIIPTREVIEPLLKALPEWGVLKYTEKNVKDVAKRGKQSHHVVLRHQMWGKEYVPTINLLNSYDRSKAFTLSVGAFRFWCENGLMIGHDWGTVKVKHIDSLVQKVDLDGFLASLPEMINRMTYDIKQMQEKKVDLDQVLPVFNKALRMRGVEEDKIKNLDWAISRSRRMEDVENTAWNVFNRVQEHVIKGGIARVGSTRLRQVTQIDKTAAINKYLWKAFSEMPGINF